MLAAGAGHDGELLGAVDVRLGGLRVAQRRQGMSQVTAEGGFGAVVGAVHSGQC